MNGIEGSTCFQSLLHLFRCIVSFSKNAASNSHTIASLSYLSTSLVLEFDRFKPGVGTVQEKTHSHLKISRHSHAQLNIVWIEREILAQQISGAGELLKIRKVSTDSDGHQTRKAQQVMLFDLIADIDHL